MDDIEVPYGVWAGGGNFYVDVKKYSSIDLVRILVGGFSHYTLFPMNQCTSSKPRQNGTMKYIMNIHTRDVQEDDAKSNTKIISGIASHFAYHRCALNISRYEIVVQPQFISTCMKNPQIAYAANKN